MPKREILGGRMTFISLCKRGINRLPVVFKADGADNKIGFNPLVKAPADFDEKGELLVVVYAPNIVDAEGDFATADAVRKMQRESTREGFNLDIWHDNKALGKDKAHVAENFLVRKGDETFQGWTDYDGKAVDLVGAWALVIKVDDPALRAKYRSGEWNGVSMFGDAEMRKVASDGGGRFERFLAAFEKACGVKDDMEDDMKADEMKTLLEANNAALATAIAKAMKGEPAPAPTPPAPAPTPAPTAGPFDKNPVLKAEFEKLDLTDIKAVQAFQLKVAKAKLAEGVNWTDPTSVSKYAGELAKLEKASAGTKTANELEVERLQSEISRLQGAPEGGAAGVEKADDEQPTSSSGNVISISKAARDAGKRIAAVANSRFPKRAAQ